MSTGFLRALGFTDYTVEEAAKIKEKKEKGEAEKDPYMEFFQDYSDNEKDAEERWKWGADEKEEKPDPFLEFHKKY